MADEIIDSLELVIASEADKAEKGLDNIIGKLGDLNTALKRIDLGSLSSFTDGLKHIPQIPLKADKTQLFKTLDELKAHFKDIGTEFTFEGNFTELQNAITETEKRLDGFYEREEKYQALGTDINSKAFRSLQYDIAKTSNELDILRDKLRLYQAEQMAAISISFGDDIFANTGLQLPDREMVSASDLNYDASAMQAVFGDGASGIHNWNQALNMFGETASNVLNSTQNELEETAEDVDMLKIILQQIDSRAWPDASSDVGQIQKMLARAKYEAKGLSASVGQVDFKAEDLESTINDIARGFGKALNAAQKMAKTVIGLRKNGGSKNHDRYGMLGMLGQSFLFSQFFSATSTIQNGLAESSQNLARYSSEYNSAISEITSALTRLQNSFGVAFKPIVEVVAPYLTIFINLMADGVNAVAQFIAALSGKRITPQASDIFKDYAVSLDGVGTSGGGAADGMDKANSAAKDLKKTILGFDELNVLNSQQQASGTGSVGTGSAGIGELLPEDMFEDVEIGNDVAAFAERIKEAWKNADFTEIGETLGEKLQEGLESIPWDKVQDGSAHTAKSIATLINGFLNADDLGATIGETIGQGINTGLTFADTFIDTLQFGQIGAFVADGINGAIGSINWRTASNMISGGINGLSQTASAFAARMDWTTTGTTIADSLNRSIELIEWTSLGSSLSDNLIGALSMLQVGIDTFDWEGLGLSVGEFIAAIDWNKIFTDAGDVISGAASGLLTGLGTAIFTGFGLTDDGDLLLARSFQTAAKTMREDGRVIAGAINDVTTAISDVDDEQKSVQEMADEFFALKRKTKLTAKEQRRLNELYEDLSGELPEFKGIVDNVETSYNDQKTAVDNLIKSTYEYYKVQARQEGLIELYQQQFKLEKQLTEKAAEYEAAQKTLSDAFDDSAYQASRMDSVLADLYDSLHPQIGAAKNVCDEYNALEAQYRTITSQINDYETAIIGITGTEEEYGASLDNLQYTINGISFTGLQSGIKFTTDMILTCMTDTNADVGYYTDSITGTLKQFGNNVGVQSEADWSSVALIIESYLLDSSLTAEEKSAAIQQAISDAFYKVETDADTSMSNVNTSVSEGVNNVEGTVNNKAIDILEAAKTGIFEPIIDAVTDVKKQAPGIAVDFIKDTASGISKNKLPVYQEMEVLRDGALSRFLAGDWFGGGAAVTSGFWAGISSGARSLLTNIENLASSLLSRFNSVLGIHSPSKAFQESGEYSMDGLGIGFLHGESSVLSTVKSISQNVQDAFNPVLSWDMALAGLQNNYALAGIPVTATMDGMIGQSKQQIETIYRASIQNDNSIASAIEQAVTRAMMYSQQNQRPIEMTTYVEVRTEDNEVLARAVQRGQETINYRNKQ